MPSFQPLRRSDRQPRRPDRKGQPGRLRLSTTITAVEPIEPRVLLAAAVPGVGVGSGLIGNYFADENFQNLAYARKDDDVDFNWGTRSPNSTVPADHFSVRWVGKVQAPLSEPYTFHTVSDSGVRLWVNGKQLISNWSEHNSAVENVGTIELTAGELYDLKLEYRETTGNAVARLLWSSPSTPAQVVPESQLYSTGAGWTSGNWLNQDIGTGLRAGSLRSAGSSYTVAGAGSAKVGATSDRLQFAYQTLNGDGSITARLTGVQNGSSSGRVGVMFRDTLGESPAFAGLLFNPATAGPAIADADEGTSPGAALRYRARRGARTLASPSSAPAGAWVRLVRDGSVFRAFTSATGADGSWVSAGNAVVPMGRTVYVGLAVSSGAADQLATARFDGVEVKETVPLGAGLDSLRDWNLGNVFVDIAKQARTFQQPNIKNPPVAVDAVGWPLADFSTILQSGFDKTGHVYAGTYKLSFNGQAKLAGWNSPLKITNQAYNAATNTTTADLTLTPPEDGGWYFGLNFFETKRTADAALGSGITNLRVIRPGYAPDTTQVFTNEYLKHLEQFSVLRFMSFTNTNNNPVVNWADRSKTTDARQATNRGVAWEYVIELANITGKDVWVNVPGRASDDYVRNMAALFKERLAPGRVVYVEYANEVWNYQFDQAQFNLAQAKAEVYGGTSNLNNDNTMNTGLWAYRRHARRTKEVGEIFADAFGPGSLNTRVRPVLGAQASNSDTVRQPLPWLEKTYGPPSNYLYAVAIAPYFGADGRDAGPGVTPDDVLDGMASSIKKRNGRHPMYHGLAARYGLRSFAYEGGTGTEGEENLDIKVQALFDSRMRQVTKDYLAGWYGTGGDLFEWFMAGPTNWTSQFGTWGLTNAVDNFDSPKLQGTIDVVEGPRTKHFAGVSVPGQLDARFHTNPSTPLWQSPPVDPYLRYLGAGATFDYSVRAPVNGTYYLRVSAAAVGGAQPLEVYVNDRKAPTVTVPDNGTDNDFDKFVDSNAVAISLRQGVNLVRLVVPGTRPYNIESLKFTTTPDGGFGDSMPVIGAMAFSNGQAIATNGSFSGVFNLADAEDGPDGLEITATSDNPVLFPDGSLVVSGTGRQRTLRVAPAAEEAGSANVQLTVTDSAGNSRTVSFTKITVRPVTPTSPRATAVAPDQVQLNWTDASGNETGFEIDRSVSSDFRSVSTVTVAAGTRGYLATGLRPNTRYYFRIRSTTTAAGGGAIDSNNSSTVSADTPVIPGYPTTPGRAAAGSSNVTGTATTLSVLGDDDGGQSALTYTWQIVSAPAGATGAKAPTFSANGTNAARNTTVTFFTPGSYTFAAGVTDAEGHRTYSHVDVTVTATLTRLEVLPRTASVNTNGKLHFVALGKDQFGADIAAGTVTWSTSGGRINATTGEFTAPSSASMVTVTAAVTTSQDTVEGTAQIAVGGVVNPPPTVVRPASAEPSPVTDTSTTLSALGDDTAGADKLTYTWASTRKPTNAANPVFSANGTNAASVTEATFSAAGLYDLRVTISDGSLSVTSVVTVDVRPTPTSVLVSPGSLELPVSGSARFSATVTDQFGTALATQPPIQWSVAAGAGTVRSDGVYTATSAEGSARVVASAEAYGLEGFADVTVTDDPTGEAPLFGEDVGPVGIAGSDTLGAGGVYTIRASGSDVFNAPDEFRFLHRQVVGDATLVARVASLSNTDPWTKAGVMIRESMAPDAKFAYSVVTPGSGASFGRRTAVGGAGGSNTVAGPNAPAWVRLTRSGNSFAGFYSTDGRTWVQLGAARTFTMDATVEVGLFLTAHDDSTLATATFDNVSVTQVTDLAAFKPVLASSAAADLEVRNAVDANGSSRWESLGGVGPGSEAWLRVDLGSTRTVNRVRLNWASSFATGYRIQGSTDGSSWTDLYSTGTGDGNVDDVLGLDARARYVRLFADTPNTAAGPVALNDFNVYGT